MAENTKIEWTDHTFNPWEGCQKVGPGCDHCYAETRNARFGGGTAVNWGPGAPRRRTSAANWRKPLQWQKQADAFYAEHGRRQRVFCASLADWADNAVPIEWLRDLCSVVELTPDLDWLMLTKRIGIVFERLIEARSHDWLAGRRNVALGITVVNQAEADRDIPKLLRTPARRRFLSMEPLLGPVDLTGEWLAAKLGEYPFKGLPREHRTKLIDLLDWVIVGGESGHGARPMHPDWARSLRDQCAAADVPFMFKQWGEWAPGANFADAIPSGTSCDFDDDLANDDARVWKVGKKAAGRLLDGVQHDGFPSPPDMFQQ